MVQIDFEYFNGELLAAETTLALLRHPDYCISGYSSVSLIPSLGILDCCSWFNAFVFCLVLIS